MANTVTITVDANTKKAEADVKGMSGKMKGALKGVGVASGALAGVGVAAAKLGQEYQEATNIIAAGTGASGEQLEGLEGSFKEIWSQVPQDASAVASAIADVNTELGFEGENLEEVSKAFLDAGRIMGEDTAPLIKSVADAMIAMGDDSDNATLRLDQMMAASQAVGVPMTQLADTIVKFGPQLDTMGFNFDEATALISNMEASGMSASKMMPGLNTAIKKLADEGVTDIQGGLADMIQSIKDADSDSMALAIATDKFGAGAGIRFVDAIDAGVFSLDTMKETLDDGIGRTAEMAESTLTMSDKMDIMKNKVKGSLTPIGDFATALGPMVMIIPALTGFISLLGASQVVQTALTWLQTAAMAALNVVMGPIGLIILGIVAAVAAAIIIFKNWDKIVETFKKGLEKIKPVFETVKAFLEGALDSLKDKWDTIWNGMIDVAKGIANPIIGVINAVIGGINILFGVLRKIKFEGEAKLGGLIPAYSFDPFGGLKDIPRIPQLAEGGIVTSPTLAMLGERGPEAVIPLNKAAAGGGITINIMGPTYGFDDFERRVGEAIVDGVRRGGFSGILATA